MVKRLCVIPARGGSKRFPRKNIQPLAGKPLLLWTLEAVQRAEIFNRIIVSTEDEEIAEIAREAGPFVPFMRPGLLATDTVSCDQVALSVIEILENQGEKFDTICIALPTCPFRSSKHVREAHELFDSRPEPNLMSVTPFEHQPFWAQGVDMNGCLVPHFPEHFRLRRQDLPESYRPNGALHILDVTWFKEKGTYSELPVIGYVMPNECSFDIDTEGDLRAAECFLKQ